MKRYQSPLGRVSELKHDHPERTASRSLPGVFGEVQFQVWPNRASMARSIRMQQGRGTPTSGFGDWHAMVKLSDGEGY